MNSQEYLEKCSALRNRTEELFEPMIKLGKSSNFKDTPTLVPEKLLIRAYDMQRLAYESLEEYKQVILALRRFHTSEQTFTSKEIFEALQLPKGVDVVDAPNGLQSTQKLGRFMAQYPEEIALITGIIPHKRIGTTTIFKFKVKASVTD